MKRPCAAEEGAPAPQRTRHQPSIKELFRVVKPIAVQAAGAGGIQGRVVGVRSNGKQRQQQAEYAEGARPPARPPLHPEAAPAAAAVSDCALSLSRQWNAKDEGAAAPAEEEGAHSPLPRGWHGAAAPAAATSGRHVAQSGAAAAAAVAAAAGGDTEEVTSCARLWPPAAWAATSAAAREQPGAAVPDAQHSSGVGGRPPLPAARACSSSCVVGQQLLGSDSDDDADCADDAASRRARGLAAAGAASRRPAGAAAAAATAAAATTPGASQVPLPAAATQPGSPPCTAAELSAVSPCRGPPAAARGPPLLLPAGVLRCLWDNGDAEVLEAAHAPQPGRVVHHNRLEELLFCFAYAAPPMRTDAHSIEE